MIDTVIHYVIRDLYPYACIGETQKVGQYMSGWSAVIECESEFVLCNIICQSIIYECILRQMT